MAENYENTYTYTARNVHNPNKVVTFTLINEHMRVNLTGLLDQVKQVGTAEEKSGEIKQQISTQAKPAAMKLLENVSGPVHVGDVNLHLVGDEFKVTFWQRAANLRLAPVRLNMGQIDNVDAAKAFEEEFMRRKESASHIGKFFGPLDYWFGWVGLLLLVGVLIRWPGKRNKT
ncbi:MAG: hypothetical protein JXB38_13335 [Anaerolineales bacterium]|nr:hypothetical protein [Anaerolineales bacterium]